jgi:ribosome maturation factor RimP
VAELQTEIEERLARVEPGVEVIALEQPGPERLRLFIDSPEGVDLGLCERVTKQLTDVLKTYSLEVSSPGFDRPLTKPAHYQRFLGRRVHVRTADPIDGRRNFTGALTGADEQAVSLDVDGAPVKIPHGRIKRSNLVPEQEGER